MKLRLLFGYMLLSSIVVVSMDHEDQEVVDTDTTQKPGFFRRVMNWFKQKNEASSEKFYDVKSRTDEISRSSRSSSVISVLPFERSESQTPVEQRPEQITEEFQPARSPRTPRSESAQGVRLRFDDDTESESSQDDTKSTVSDEKSESSRSESSSSPKKTFRDTWADFFKKRMPSIWPKDAQDSEKMPGLPLSSAEVESYQKIHDILHKFDSFFLRKTIKPHLNKVFPVDEYQAILRDIIKYKKLPFDAGEKIDAIVEKMDFRGIYKQSVKMILAKSLITNRSEYQEYAKESFQMLSVLPTPSIEGIENIIQDVQKVVKIIQTSENPEHLILQMHEASLDTFKKVPFDKFLATAKTVREHGVASADKILYFSNVYRTYMMMALGLAVINVICLSVVLDEEFGTQKYRIAQDIIASIALFDTLAFIAQTGGKMALVDKFQNLVMSEKDILDTHGKNMAKKKQEIEAKKIRSEVV